MFHFIEKLSLYKYLIYSELILIFKAWAGLFVSVLEMRILTPNFTDL